MEGVASCHPRGRAKLRDLRQKCSPRSPKDGDNISRELLLSSLATRFAEFDFTLVHKPGKTLGKADLLSRRADYDKGERDNENVTFIKKEWLVRGMVQTSREVLVEKVVEAQRQEDEGVRPKDVEKRGDMWRKGRRLYVPASIREDVMKEHHDSTLAGHPGATKTIQLITRRYWWPRMSADVRVYVRGCDRCQRTKALRTTRAKVLHPNEVPEAPWQIVTVDLIGELPESNGFNAICVVVDRFSKQIHAIPTTKVNGGRHG
ncbi:hypothetical protein ACEPAF_8931 [Sanghuangporus sanghuang]